ncbi:hypothetical protein PT7_0522 [Pusillimonas sp. T7-7]|nr:hypothetical protein PT7_0522 [Pusillimonas sp. T7-7]
MNRPLRILLAFAIGFGIYKIGQQGLGGSTSGAAPESVSVSEKQ